jgi:OOP family OmpA-OmpF porin
MLTDSPNLKVVLQGHTDAKGTDQYNEKLGLQRAESVRQELVSQGVTADRLSTVTFGETQPVYTDDTDWARAVNRRVEVHPDGAAPAPAPVVPAVAE